MSPTMNSAKRRMGKTDRIVYIDALRGTLTHMFNEATAGYIANNNILD